MNKTAERETQKYVNGTAIARMTAAFRMPVLGEVSGHRCYRTPYWDTCIGIEIEAREANRKQGATES